MNKPLLRIVVMLVVGAAAAGGIYAYKLRQKEAAAARLLDEALGDLAAVEVDAAGHAYIDGLARRYHEEAAAGAFDARRVTGGRFDVNRYQLLLVDAIAAHARRDSAENIADKLEAFKLTARLELVEPAPPQ